MQFELSMQAWAELNKLSSDEATRSCRAVQREPQVLAQLLPTAAEAPAGHCQKLLMVTCRVLNITKD